jgi:bacteriorhodopsin
MKDPLLRKKLCEKKTMDGLLFQLTGYDSNREPVCGCCYATEEECITWAVNTNNTHDGGYKWAYYTIEVVQERKE